MVGAPAIDASVASQWPQLAALSSTLGAPRTRKLVSLLTETAPVDGRAARSFHTRRAVVEGLRELHAGGDLRPTAAQVAVQVGVSLRTVRLHFADREGLMVESSRRDLEVLLGLMTVIDTDRSAPDRISEFVEQRTNILERMSPSWRAARHYDPFSAPLQEFKSLMNALARAEIEAVFATELGQRPTSQRTRTVDALAGVTLWAHWESLRSDLNLTVSRARRTVHEEVSALLAASRVSIGAVPATHE